MKARADTAKENPSLTKKPLIELMKYSNTEFSGKTDEREFMKLIKTSILPLVALLILTYVGKHIFIVNGQIDWFRLCLVYGIPFGIPYMLFILPIGGDPASSTAIIVMNIIVGGLFGSVIAVFAAVRAVIYLLSWVIKHLFFRKTAI